MASGRPSTTHSCPGKCGRDVPRNQFACRSCWDRLPHGLRKPITDNHLLDRAAHLAAMAVACDWYREHPLAAPSVAVEERCLHEMLPGQCAFCLGKHSPEEESLVVRARLLASGWFVAQYRGVCGRCGTPFEQGVAIRMADRSWRAECCADDEGGS